MPVVHFCTNTVSSWSIFQLFYMSESQSCHMSLFPSCHIAKAVWVTGVECDHNSTIVSREPRPLFTLGAWSLASSELFNWSFLAETEREAQLLPNHSSLKLFQGQGRGWKCKNKAYTIKHYGLRNCTLIMETLSEIFCPHYWYFTGTACIKRITLTAGWDTHELL